MSHFTSHSPSAIWNICYSKFKKKKNTKMLFKKTTIPLILNKVNIYVIKKNLWLTHFNFILSNSNFMFLSMKFMPTIIIILKFLFLILQFILDFKFLSYLQMLSFWSVLLLRKQVGQLSIAKWKMMYIKEQKKCPRRSLFIFESIGSLIRLTRFCLWWG